MNKELSPLEALYRVEELPVPVSEDGTVLFNETKEYDIIETALKRLKSIEDELNIDLITLFKAMQNGCYAKSNGKIYKMNIVRLDNQNKESIILFRNKYYGGECYLLKDYGKTWALMREELEHDKK